MKIFLSWSGEISHRVACVLRDWLPSVIQALKPYVSSEDIDKGTRWSTDIALELENSTFGIICLTADNLHAPWINFEAGALSRAIDKNFVTPFLFGMKRSDVTGPLTQFQSTIYERADVHRLLATLNQRLPAEDRLVDANLNKSFDRWWPDLQTQLAEIEAAQSVPRSPRGKAVVTPESRSEVILEELLELARAQQRLLKSPDELLPPEYILRFVSRGPVSTNLGSHLVRLRELSESLLELLKRIKQDSSSDMALYVAQAQRILLLIRMDLDDLFFTATGTRFLPSDNESATRLTS